jgi:hypothetical protein
MELITDATVSVALEYITDPANAHAQVTVSWSSVASGNVGIFNYGERAAGQDIGTVDITTSKEDNLAADGNSFTTTVMGLDLGAQYVFAVSTVERPAGGRDQQLAASNRALFLTPSANVQPGAVLTQPMAKPHDVKPPNTSNISVKVQNRGQAVPGAFVLFSLTSQDDHQLSAAGQAPDRFVAVTSGADGTASATFKPGMDTGIAVVQVTSSGAQGNVNININVLG